MRKTLVFGTLMIGLLVTAPEDAWGQKKKDAKGPDSRVATPQEYAAVSRLKEMVGKLQNIDTQGGTISFLLEYTHPEVQKKAGAAPAKKGKGRRPNVTVVQKTERIDFELKVQAKAPLRKSSLGIEYDARGNLKEYTAEEKAKLKGKDASLPGYMASIDDFKPGSLIKIYLNPAKAAAKDDPTSGRPTVKMIVLLPEPDRPVQKGAALPKKKK